MADENEIVIRERVLGDKIPVLSIKGTLDWDTHPRCDAELIRLFNSGSYQIVIDLTDIDYVTSAGFGSFITNISVARRNGGNIVFLAAPPQVKEVFTMLGLTPFMTFAEDENEAVAALSAPQPQTPGLNLIESSGSVDDSSKSSVDLPIPD